MILSPAYVIEASTASLLRSADAKDRCSEARRLSHRAPRIKCCGTIVTSCSWIELIIVLICSYTRKEKTVCNPAFNKFFQSKSFSLVSSASRTLAGQPEAAR